MVQEDALATIESTRKKPDKVQTGVNCEGKTTRQIEIYNEDGTECITIGASTTTKTTEVVDIVAAIANIDPTKIMLTTRVGSYRKAQSMFEEAASQVTACGVKSFSRKIKKYDHPIVVIGAGLGGIQTMLMLQMKRKDIICFDKCDDFGGHSWINVANRFTKLQTEKGTYHVDFINPGNEVPTMFKDSTYKTWPTRDQLLTMFRESARAHGLYEFTRFQMNVEKVRPMPGRAEYSVQVTPEGGHESEEDSTELTIASAVMAWPGNLTRCNMIEFPGEEEFGGYIEYSSFCKFDYSKARGKEVILYGHGAFTIENVRTLLEHRCTKVSVLCRKRNLCGMKVVSWMVGLAPVPIPGNVMLEAFEPMYKLADFDVWSAHSVKTDAKRSFAHISQKTVFGVTDIYFLAAYYGIMEIVVDEIKRLTPGVAHTKKGKKIPCDVIVKAVGTVPCFSIDKMLGLKALHGLWVNGDPLRPCVCNAMYVEARNFSSFSSGPAYASMAPAINWFVDYPEDWNAVKDMMPVNKPGERPGYVPSASHMTPTFHQFNSVPALANHLSIFDGLKARKQGEAHPVEEYIADCKREWEGYIRAFKKFGMIDDRPEPAYPYTGEMVRGWIQRSVDFWTAKAQR